MATVSATSLEAAITQAYKLPVAIQVAYISANLQTLNVPIEERYIEQVLGRTPWDLSPESAWRESVVGDLVSILSMMGHIITFEPRPKPPPDDLFSAAMTAYRTHGEIPRDIYTMLNSMGYRIEYAWVVEALNRLRETTVYPGTEGNFFAQNLQGIAWAHAHLGEAAMANFTGAEYAQRWVDRLRGQWSHICNQAKKVTVNPADQAVAAKDRWVSKMTQSETHDRWEAALGRVTLDEWKSTFNTALSPAFQANVDAAQSKMVQFGTWLGPQLDAIRSQVDATAPPGVTLDEQAERARQWILAWRNRRYKAL